MKLSWFVYRRVRRLHDSNPLILKSISDHFGWHFHTDQINQQSQEYKSTKKKREGKKRY